MNEYEVRYQQGAEVKSSTFHADSFGAVMKKIELWIEVNSILSIQKTRKVTVQ